MFWAKCSKTILAERSGGSISPSPRYCRKPASEFGIMVAQIWWAGFYSALIRQTVLLSSSDSSSEPSVSSATQAGVIGRRAFS